jgi:hypothetical protein
VGYSDNHHFSTDLAYVITDLLLQANRSGQGSADRVQDMDLIVLKLQGYCSCFTQPSKGKPGDKEFADEWRKVQEDREALHTATKKDYRPGQEGYEPEDLAFRMREFGCLVRSAHRNGVISKLPTPSTTWEPNVRVMNHEA